MASTLSAVTVPLVQSGKPGQATGSPSSVPSAPQVKRWGLPGADLLSKDLEHLSDRINSINKTISTAKPQISQILVTDSVTGKVVAALGNMTYQGVVYTNWLREIHAGDYLLTNDPTKAVFNVNFDGSVSIGGNGFIDVHDPYDGNAAWIGTQFDTLPITGAADNGAGLIRLLITGHTLATGNAGVQVLGMQFAGVPNATGTWTVTSVDANHVDLQNSVWAGAFVMPVAMGGIPTQNPTINRVLQVTGASNNGGLIRLKFGIATGYESGTSVHVELVGGVPNATGQWITSIPSTLAVTGAVNNGSGLIRLTVANHNFTTGDKPQILNVGGVPNANGYFTLTVIDATHVDLQGSVFAGAYTAGGTCLQYFAGVLAQTIAIGTSFASYKLRAFPSGDLRIKNASIELSSPVGQIVLDPNTTQIRLTNFTNLSQIVLDATVPSLTFSDQIGDPSVTIEILQETAMAITGATNAAPVVLTVPGHTYINGDTVLIQGATGNTVINGYRIVEGIVTPGGTFTLTDLQGGVINGNGALAGAATAARYYAGLLAQTLALGSSFAAYRLRFFADGSLKINQASIDQSAITNSSVSVTTFTSTGGAAPNQLTLTITNGLLTVSGAGTAAGTGAVTIDGKMTASGYAVGATLGINGPVTVGPLVMTFTKGIFTAQTGTFPTGLAGVTTATVRNAAGTGTSTLTFTDGVLTGYTP